MMTTALAPVRPGHHDVTDQKGRQPPVTTTVTRARHAGTEREPGALEALRNHPQLPCKTRGVRGVSETFGYGVSVTPSATIAADGRPAPGKGPSSTPRPSTVPPPPSTTARRPGTPPALPAASQPPVAESAGAFATAATCTDPSRTPPPPPSSAASDHHTPGSTAEPSRQPPQPRSSRRTHLTARDQKHLLMLRGATRVAGTPGPATSPGDRLRVLPP